MSNDVTFSEICTGIVGLGAVALFLFIVLIHPAIVDSAERKSAAKSIGIDEYKISPYGEVISDGVIYSTKRMIEINENNELICHIKFVRVEPIEKGFFVIMKQSNYRTKVLNTTQPCD